jgi:DNA-binding NarL/FixJ family response regulator
MAKPGLRADALGMDSSADNHRPPMRCLLAEDSEPVRSALASLLGEEGIEVVGQAATGLEALVMLEELPTTVVLLDVRLPDLNGLDVARRAAEILRKKTSIVFYTSYADSAFVRDALDAGARGVVLKDAPPSNLLDALAEVAGGGVYLDPRLRPTSESSR